MARCERTLHVENRHQPRVVDVGLLVRGNRSLLRAEGLGVSGVVAVLRLYQAIAGLLVLIVTFVAVLLLDVDMHVGLRAHAAALDLLVQEGLLFEIYKLVIRVAIFVRIVACFVAVGFDHIARVHWGLNCIRHDLLIFAWCPTLQGLLRRKAYDLLRARLARERPLIRCFLVDGCAYGGSAFAGPFRGGYDAGPRGRDFDFPFGRLLDLLLADGLLLILLVAGERDVSGCHPATAGVFFGDLGYLTHFLAFSVLPCPVRQEARL